jgi:hypothetical protein
VDLYIHSPIRLHGIVLNWSNTGATFLLDCFTRRLTFLNVCLQRSRRISRDVPVRTVEECGRPTQSLRCKKKAMRSVEVRHYCDMTFTNVNSLLPTSYLSEAVLTNLSESYYGAQHTLQACLCGSKRLTKNSIFWHITSCRPIKVNRRFRDTYRLYLQYRRANQA